MQYFYIVYFLLFYTINAYSISPIINPSSILDTPGKIIKEGINAYKKKKEDEQSQSEYDIEFKNFKKKEENIEKLNEERQNLLNRFEGLWVGFIKLDYDEVKLNCKISIIIKNSKFDKSFLCQNEIIYLKIKINLNQIFEDSFLRINKNTYQIYGDISSFGNKDKNLKILGNFEKIN